MEEAARAALLEAIIRLATAANDSETVFELTAAYEKLVPEEPEAETDESIYATGSTQMLPTEDNDYLIDNRKRIGF